MTEDKYCSPGEGLFCNNEPVNNCTLCNTYTCTSHGKPEHCNRCFKVVQRISETKQGLHDCYFANCKVKPVAGCDFCDRLTCGSHRNESNCLRCHKALTKLQKQLKANDKWERDEAEKVSKLPIDLQKSYLTFKIYNDTGEFWYLVSTKMGITFKN